MSEMTYELFTELSSEQAATVEGGLTLTITRITCQKAGADGFLGGGDDVYVKANGKTIFGFLDSFKGGTSRAVDSKFKVSSSSSSIAVDLFDSDFPSQDDFLGGFTARSTGGQVVSKEISGSGSKYRIFYRAI